MKPDYSVSEPLAVELMNTVGLADGVLQDGLEDAAGVAAWLDAFGDRISAEAGTALVGPNRLDAVGARRLRDLRDALRKLAAEATDDPRSATTPELTRQEAIKTLNPLARVWPELSWPASGLPSRRFRTADDLAVGLIAHQAVELFAGPGRLQLRACIAPGCALFFFKRSTRREWCSPACGNRARVARHYVRHHAARTH